MTLPSFPVGSQARGASTRVGYSKLCQLTDFEDSDFIATMRAVFANDVERYGPRWPRGYEHRKLWEVTMAARTLDDFGALHEDAEVLGIGAGDEQTIFWLTTKVKRVFATDLYLDPGTWAREANSSMLVDPGSHAHSPWNGRRLVVQHMNALELAYEDESFDAIFSSSSIEHFGTHEDVRKSVAEMFRVLKPGGVVTLSTEFRLEGPSPGLPGALMFDEGELHEWIIDPFPWSLLAPLDLEPSAGEPEVDFEACVAGDVQFPHIRLRKDEHLWTSVHLALRKP